MKEPLDEAIDNCHADPGQFEIIKTLLEKEGAKVDPNNSKTWTLFILAVYPFYEGGDNKALTELKNTVARLVVEKGLDAHATQNGNGTHKETPLILVALAGNLAIARYLVEEKNANVNAADDEGATPLRLAKEHTDQALATYLIGKGAKMDAVGKFGRKPKHIASDSPVLAPPPAAEPPKVWKDLRDLFSKKK